MISITQRSHIKTHCNGGTEAVENLYNLCKRCHEQSETLEGLSCWMFYVKNTEAAMNYYITDIESHPMYQQLLHEHTSSLERI